MSKKNNPDQSLFGISNILFGSNRDGQSFEAESESPQDLIAQRMGANQEIHETRSQPIIIDGIEIAEITDGENNEELTEKTLRIHASESIRTSANIERFITIRVISGAEMLKYQVLNVGDQIMVGREEVCELRLNNGTVSKKHAIINYNKQKQLSIIDVGSTNGTFVNKSLIDMPTTLTDGDNIDIGDITLQVAIVTTAELEHMQEMVNKLENAVRDNLTNLYRRGFIETELPKLVEQRRQVGEPISCAFIDLDRFKPINDTYGHQVGDKVLKIVAQIMLGIVRKNDPCIRYGGDEMLVILPKSSENRAAKVINRIKQQIMATSWDNIAENCIGLQVTASFGVAELRKGESIQHWLHRADMAAYAAKDGGRNAVRTYSSLNQEEKKRANRNSLQARAQNASNPNSTIVPISSSTSNTNGRI